MVDYKSKIYTEEEGHIQGIEITIFSEEGDKIKTLQVVTEEDYNNLQEQLKDLGEVYVKFSNLEDALTTVTVNANTFEGLSVSSFSKVGHNHTEYSKTNHSDTSDKYGVGTPSRYGHTKVINNLLTSVNRDGESLSAYQGKILSDKIDSQIRSITGSNSIGKLNLNNQWSGNDGKFVIRNGFIIITFSAKTTGEFVNPFTPFTVNAPYRPIMNVKNAVKIIVPGVGQIAGTLEITTGGDASIHSGRSVYPSGTGVYGMIVYPY